MNLVGFITLRHNEVVDVTTNLLSRLCKDFSKEHVLSSTATCNDDLRKNISSREFWRRMQ